MYGGFKQPGGENKTPNLSARTEIKIKNCSQNSYTPATSGLISV
jgi:hypothetical protein